MSLSNFETQVLHDVLSLAVVVVGSLFSALAIHAKAWISAHMKTKTAATADTVIDGLSKIANAVVQEFELNIVAVAKQEGNFTPEMAQQVKAEAISAVRSQSGRLLNVGKDVLGDVDSVISSLIEKAVLQQKQSQ